MSGILFKWNVVYFSINIYRARDREYIRIYKIYERRLSRFKKILNETGADLLHKNLLRMLSQKSDQLLSDFKVKPIMGLATNENRGKMTDK